MLVLKQELLGKINKSKSKKFRFVKVAGN